MLLSPALHFPNTWIKKHLISSNTCGFSPVYMRRCLLRIVLSVKCLLHTHVVFLLCAYWRDGFEDYPYEKKNCLLHTSHTCGFSPVCLKRWVTLLSKLFAAYITNMLFFSSVRAESGFWDVPFEQTVCRTHHTHVVLFEGRCDCSGYSY